MQSNCAINHKIQDSFSNIYDLRIMKHYIQNIGTSFLRNFRRKLEKLAKFVCLKIGRKENFIMQMSYGDKNIFNIFFLFIIEKFDFLVEMPPEREVL